MHNNAVPSPTLYSLEKIQNRDQSSQGLRHSVPLVLCIRRSPACTLS